MIKASDERIFVEVFENLRILSDELEGRSRAGLVLRFYKKGIVSLGRLGEW